MMFTNNFLFLLIFLLCKYFVSATEYIYLPDTHIDEEMPAYSLVCDLSKKLPSKIGFSYTLLDDSSTSYFVLNASTILLTRAKLDREYLCANSLCAEPCSLGTYSNSDQSCKLNIKILQVPTYSILNMNVLVHDINDNYPIFGKKELVLQINENSPVDYTIPLELAYDPDVNTNTIQKYEILHNADLVPFSLQQNLNESKLNLVVSSNLDRELKSEYKMEIRAVDPSASMCTQILVIKILDENDNKPVFSKDYYKFYIRENLPMDTLIGKVHAIDLDADLNGQLKYSFVDSSPKFMNFRPTLKKSNNKFFYLNESSGELRLKNSIDYEEESFFSLIIEASDCGEVRKLADYAHVDIEVLDENDNGPEISVSFLNSNYNDKEVYVSEDCEENKFIAHVSIYDKDSAKNAIFNWKILVNKQELDSQPSALKVNVLNNNSFTLNIGNSELFDYELNDHFNVTIVAWDVQNLMNDETKFRVVVLDVNDNAPQFEKNVYNVTIMEAKPGDYLLNVTAVDRDKNSIVTLEIVEKEAKKYVTMQNGHLKMKKNFSHLSFQVRAKDNGVPSLSTKAQVSITNFNLKNKTKFVSPYKFWYEQDILVFSVQLSNANSKFKLVEFEQEAQILGKLPTELVLYSNVIYSSGNVYSKSALIRLKIKNDEIKIKFSFTNNSDNFCLNSYQSLKINSLVKFEKLVELTQNFELFYTSSNLNSIYSIVSVEKNLDLEFKIIVQGRLEFNTSRVVLKDENGTLINVYRLTITTNEVVNSNLIVKITNKKNAFCVLEDSFVCFVDNGLFKLVKNGPNNAKSFMYKVSSADKSVNLNRRVNFLTLLMILTCVILVFFISLFLMIIKYFNYYKYKKNLKKTTNILQREFSFKSDENKDKIRIKSAKPTYSYTAYRHQIQDEASKSVKYVSKPANFVQNKYFHPQSSITMPREKHSSSPSGSNYSQSSFNTNRFKILI